MADKKNCVRIVRRLLHEEQDVASDSQAPTAFTLVSELERRLERLRGLGNTFAGVRLSSHVRQLKRVSSVDRRGGCKVAMER